MNLEYDTDETDIDEAPPDGWATLTVLTEMILAVLAVIIAILA